MRILRPISFRSLGRALVLLPLLLTVRGAVRAPAREIPVRGLDPAALQAAADSSRPGDVLVLPAGESPDFSTPVTIPAGVSLRGRGRTATILKRHSGAGPMLVWENSGGPSNHPVTITGFSLEGIGGGNGNSGTGIKLVKLVDFRVHDMEFREMPGQGLFVVEGRGVVYKCRFIDIFPEHLGRTGYGVLVHGDDAWDENPPALGTEDAVFVEDCVFDHCKHGVDANEDGRYTARFNVFRRPVSNRAMIMVHGKQPTHRAAARSFEIYGNTVYGDSGRKDDWGVTIRGGCGVIWDNDFFDLEEPRALPPHKAIGFTIDDHGDYPEDYPDVFQIRGVYVWGNRLNGRPLANAVRVTSLAREWVKAGREFFSVRPEGYRPFAYPHPLRKKAGGAAR
jgi:hypothetical protein